MFGKPTKGSIKKVAVFAVSATAGAMLSDAVVNVIPSQYTEGKEDMVRGGLALVAAGGAAAIKGTSTQAMAVKMALVGMTLAQVRNIIKGLASKAGVDQVSVNSEVSEKFVAGLFGLACPCDTMPAKAMQARMPRLNANAFDFQGQKLQNLGIRKGQPVLATAFD